MWIRWAEDVDVSIRGEDATMHGPACDLFLPLGAKLITKLRDLLTSVMPITALEEALGQYASASHVASLLADLLNAQMLLVWELGVELVELHQATVTLREYPVLPPILETSRLLRETAGHSGISLPYPRETDATLGDALSQRRTCRHFVAGTEPMEQLGTILGMAVAAGVAAPAAPMMPGAPAANRPYPSGGGLYPVEIVIYAATIEDIPPAFYYYQPLAHRLIPTAPSQPDIEMKRLLSNHPVEGASFCIFLYLDFMRVGLSRYGLKSYRLALLEAGHIAQSLLLAATIAGRGTLPLCGFDDKHLSKAAGLDYPEQAIVYGIAIGRRAEVSA